MNIESLRTKQVKDFTDFYGGEGLAVIKDYFENDNEVLYFIISDAISRSCSHADTVLLNILKNKLNINDIDKELYAALRGKLIEISNKEHLSNFKPFDFIKRCDPSQVLNLLLMEMPQTIAVVLSFLEANTAALLLQYFPDEVKSDVARRISTMDRIETETIREIEKILEKKLMVLAHDDIADCPGGVGSMVEILNYVDRDTEKQIIGLLEDEDPELAEEIKRRMFVFEDIVMLDDRATQKLLREVDSQELAKALKSADVKVQNKFFSNMSKRATAILKEDMEYMGPVRLSDVTEAQSKIISIIRHLEDIGEIVVAKAGGDILVDAKAPEIPASDERKELPYNAMSGLIINSNEKAFIMLDDKTLAVSLFGTEERQKEIILKKLKHGKKMNVIKIIKGLKEIWYDDVFEAQTMVINMLQNDYGKDTNDSDDLFFEE